MGKCHEQEGKVAALQKEFLPERDNDLRDHILTGADTDIIELARTAVQVFAHAFPGDQLDRQTIKLSNRVDKLGQEGFDGWTITGGDESNLQAFAEN